MLDKTNQTVLIIDDDESIARTFSRILQRNGYETDIAQTAKEAIEKSTAKFYDVALIDICLPDMNGMDLLHQLADHGGKMVKIIVTGFPMVANGDVRPDAYLLKPVKPQDLLSLIKQKTKQT